MNVKERLKNMRDQNGLDDDEVTRDNLLKQRNQYKSFLKDYLKSYQQGYKKQEMQGALSQKNLQKKMKALQVRTHFRRPPQKNKKSQPPPPRQ